jgi:hypothetical protein
VREFENELAFQTFHVWLPSARSSAAQSEPDLSLYRFLFGGVRLVSSASPFDGKFSRESIGTIVECNELANEPHSVSLEFNNRQLH